MIKIAITGGMGSGKTTVSKIFSLLDIPIYAADDRSKLLLKNDDVLKSELVQTFGNQIISKNEIDRFKFAQLIFENKINLQKANSIIHPRVKLDYLHWCEINKNYKFTILESAILFDSNFDCLVDYSINVSAPLKLRIERCLKRDNVSRKDIEDRINNQMLEEDRNKRANFIIKNDDYNSVIEQVFKILSKLNK